MALSYERRKKLIIGLGRGGGGLGVPEFITGSSVAYANRTNTTIPAPPLPIVNGDLMVMFFDIGVPAPGPPPTPTFPGAFGALAGFPVNLVDSNGFTLDVRILTQPANNESGDYLITHAAANSTAFLAIIRNANAVTPFSPAFTINTGTGATGTAPGLTPNTLFTMVMFWASVWQAANLVTGPGGVTPAFTLRNDVGLLNVQTGIMDSLTATGDKTFGTGNTQGTDPWASGLLAIRP